MTCKMSAEFQPLGPMIDEEVTLGPMIDEEVI